RPPGRVTVKRLASWVTTSVIRISTRRSMLALLGFYLLQQLAQHVGQDAAVAVIGDFSWCIDANFRLEVPGIALAIASLYLDALGQLVAAFDAGDVESLLATQPQRLGAVAV